jgi:hypothetical protein
MCLALWLVWVTLRRSYGFSSTSIGVLSVFCTSSIVLSQNAEARMYGLFLAAAAWCFFLYDAACRKRGLARLAFGHSLRARSSR